MVKKKNNKSKDLKKENKQSLRKKIFSLDSRRKRAWRCFYNTRDELYECKRILKQFTEIAEQSDRFFEKIPKHFIDKVKEHIIENCPICLEKIKKDDLTVTGCGHCYCYQCIMQASEHDKKCPICRKNIRF